MPCPNPRILPPKLHLKSRILPQPLAIRPIHLMTDSRLQIWIARKERSMLHPIVPMLARLEIYPRPRRPTRAQLQNRLVDRVRTRSCKNDRFLDDIGFEMDNGGVREGMPGVQAVLAD